MRFARGRKAAMSAPSRAETIASTTGNGDADRGVRHERIAAADRVESAAPRCVSSHHRVDVRGERSLNTLFQAAKARRRLEDAEFLAIFRATRNPEESSRERSPRTRHRDKRG
jgi:hypothetical protein